MVNYNFTVEQMREKIESKLSHNFGVTPAEATDEHFYKAVALVVSRRPSGLRKTIN